MADMNDVLRRLNALPDDLPSCPADALLDRLGGPTLITLPGKDPRPIFLSVLLHGNEISGWNGLRRYLAQTPVLPHRTTIFIGNLEAAAAGLRTLPGQQDYNRIWRGAAEPEASLAREVRSVIDALPWFAAIDLHNNTGHNPHYAVLTDVTPHNLGLARLFSDKAMLVEQPDTAMTRVFDGICPAVTLELGSIADDRSEERCRDFLERCFALQAVPTAAREQIRLFRALARVHVVEHTAFRFAGNDGVPEQRCETDPPLVLTGDVEGVNFRQLPAGFELGSGTGELSRLLTVLDADHRDVTQRYLEIENGRIRLTRSVTPAMYTTDPVGVRQDCLCYFMEVMASA